MKLIVALAALVAVAVAIPIGPDSEAQVLRLDSDNIGVDGYSYGYETSNNIKGEESGRLVNPGTDNENIVVNGQYSYVGPDGVTYAVQYLADENGFQPQGAHIPQ